MSALKWGDVSDTTPVEHITPIATTTTTTPATLIPPSQLPPAQAQQPATLIPPSTAQIQEASATNTAINQLSESMMSLPPLDESRTTDTEEPIMSATTGLHPNDRTAVVELVNPTGAIYKAAETFDQLGLSKELLNAVYELKFTTPSKIQAQALPIILSNAHPHLIGQAHHGSGKTAAFSLGILSRVNPKLNAPQALVVVPTRELAVQVASVLTSLAKYTDIKVYCAIPPAIPNQPIERIAIHEQVVVGTPGTILSKLQRRDIDNRNLLIFVADEADQMIAQDGLGDKTIMIKNKLPRSVQILLFSATFDNATRIFSKKIVPDAVSIVVKTEELSLDSIKQFYMDCQSVDDKYITLTNIYGLLEIGQSIIFVHTVATAKALANRMRTDGYAVSLLHGKDMVPGERDRVMEDFRQHKTTVLITTNVLARGIDVLSVTLVVNFDIPLNRYNKPDPETYIHRIGRSGRFGRKGVAINLVCDEKSRNDLAFIAQHFNKDIAELPTKDLEKTSQIVQEALKSAA